MLVNLIDLLHRELAHLDAEARSGGHDADFRRHVERRAEGVALLAASIARAALVTDAPSAA